MVGLYDDIKNINPLIRLLLASIFFYVAILLNNELLLSNINFLSFGLKLHLGNFSIFVTLLCMLLLLNALNMFDGINNQIGLYLIVIFIIFYIKNINQFYSILMIISLLFFLYFNFKNQLFMGNAGIWFFASFLSCKFILSYNKNLIDVETILIILLFPGLDMLRVFFQRILKKKHPFVSDKNHIHHLLIEFVSEVYAVIIIFFSYLIPILFFFITGRFVFSLILMIIIYFTLIFSCKKFSNIK